LIPKRKFSFPADAAFSASVESVGVDAAVCTLGRAGDQFAGDAIEIRELARFDELPALGRPRPAAPRI
jgi:hypothetical protein